MFPPTPLTVQGALRRKISESLGVSLQAYKDVRTPQAEKAVQYIGPYGPELETNAFRMAGPYPGLRMGQDLVPLLPAPADLFWREEDGKFLITAPDMTVTSDLPDVTLFPRVVQDYENLPDYWMTADVFDRYLSKTAPDASMMFHEETHEGDQSEESVDLAASYADGKRIWPGKSVYVSENRFGVDVNAITSFREEGLLYQVQFVRPQQGVGLLVLVDGDHEADLLDGEISLGGEQRRASAHQIAGVGIPSAPETVSGRFKVVFLAPAYFSGGWQPENGDWSALFGSDVKFVSAALYRPRRIGGWNSAAVPPRPRTMHNYVTPGSVYYFEAAHEVKLPPALTENPDEIASAAAIGFGQYAIGAW